MRVEEGRRIKFMPQSGGSYQFAEKYSTADKEAPQVAQGESIHKVS